MPETAAQGKIRYPPRKGHLRWSGSRYSETHVDSQRRFLIGSSAALNNHGKFRVGMRRRQSRSQSRSTETQATEDGASALFLAISDRFAALRTYAIGKTVFPRPSFFRGGAAVTKPVACPDRRELERLVLGELPEPEAETLCEHLLACAHCSTLLESLQVKDPLMAWCAFATRTPCNRCGRWWGILALSTEFPGVGTAGRSLRAA